jgi:uncharacterized protein (TIGR02996 family)
MSDADVEARFISMLQADPNNDEPRFVYADWLEERGDVRAKYLRLETMMWSLPSQITDLRQQLDAAWLRAVTRSIDVYLVSCQPTHKIQTIKFVRGVTGLGLKDAKDFVEGKLPTLLQRDVSLDQALRWAAEIAADATIELRSGNNVLVADALVGFGPIVRDMRVVLVDIADRAAIPKMEMSSGASVYEDGLVVCEGVTKSEAMNVYARLRAAGIQSRIELMM